STARWAAWLNLACVSHTWGTVVRSISLGISVSGQPLAAKWHSPQFRLPRHTSFSAGATRSASERCSGGMGTLPGNGRGLPEVAAVGDVTGGAIELHRGFDVLGVQQQLVALLVGLTHLRQRERLAVRHAHDARREVQLVVELELAGIGLHAAERRVRAFREARHSPCELQLADLDVTGEVGVTTGTIAVAKAHQRMLTALMIAVAACARLFRDLPRVVHRPG